VVGLPSRDRQEDEEESGLDSSESTWWAKQLGREPRRSGQGAAPSEARTRKDAQLSDALLEAEEAAVEDERERAETVGLSPPDENRKYEGGNRPSAGAASGIEQQMRITEERIRKATARLAEATTQLAQADERLAEVEEERHTLAGEAAMNRRAIADLQQLLEESRQEVASLHVQEAHQTLDKAVEARDLAVREAASALEWIKTALQQLDERRAAVGQAENELRAIDPEPSITIAPEPELVDAAWDAVIPLVRARLEERLEIDLVEAAVASQRANAIDDLPQHLRELARQRRNQRLREALARQHSDSSDQTT
jgi:DNA repair exonuclease SbcCD ATPase subunit